MLDTILQFDNTVKQAGFTPLEIGEEAVGSLP